MKHYSKISGWLLATLLMIGALYTLSGIAARQLDEKPNIDVRHGGEEMVEGAQKVHRGIADKILHPLGGKGHENVGGDSMKQAEHKAKDSVDQMRQSGNEALDTASTKTKEKSDTLMDKVGLDGNRGGSARDEEPVTARVKEGSKAAFDSAQDKAEEMQDIASEQAQEAKRSILDRITHPFGGSAEQAAQKAKYKASEQMDDTSNQAKEYSGSIADRARDTIEQAKAKGSEYSRNLQDAGSQASGKGQEYYDALNQGMMNAREKAMQGKDTVSEKAMQGKDTVADTLNSAKQSGQEYMESAKDTAETVQRKAGEAVGSTAGKWDIGERTIDELALKHGEEELKQIYEAAAEGRLHIVPDVQSMQKSLDGSFQFKGGDKYVDHAALEHVEAVMREIRDAVAQGKLKVVPHSEWCASSSLSSSSKSCDKESLLDRMNPFKSSSIESKLDTSALKRGEEELRHVREMAMSGKLKKSGEEMEKSEGLLHRMNPFKSDEKAIDCSALKDAEDEIRKLKQAMSSGSFMQDTSQSVQEERRDDDSIADKIKSRLTGMGQKFKTDL